MAMDKEDERRMRILKERAMNVKFDLNDTDYKKIENIGIGAYGVVCSALNKRTMRKVAIKKIPNIFDVHTTAMRTYREIKILKHFKHDNIIAIREILRPKEHWDTFRDVYVVLDLMESDLHRIVHSHQELSDEHIRYFLYQIVRGLKYIHSANVIHRDLKPSNLLVNEDCLLKIGDFGMARGVTSTPGQHNPFMTQYVATRWYRAPEIMMSHLRYSVAADMWSVGCVLAEMLGRKVLFPGKDFLNQLKLICSVLGTPAVDYLSSIQSDMIRTIVERMGAKDSTPWNKLYPVANRKALDLLGKLVTFNPQDRATAEDVLRHPYLSKYHDPQDEPQCIPAFNFDFETESMRGQALREAIIKEITTYDKSTKKLNILKFPPAVCSNSVQSPTNQHTNENLKTRPNYSSESSSNVQNTDIVFSTPKSEVKFTEKSQLCTENTRFHTENTKVHMENAQNTQLAMENTQNTEQFRENSTLTEATQCQHTLNNELLVIETELKEVIDIDMPTAESMKELTIDDKAEDKADEKDESIGERKSELKTISDDTKALIKATLLQSQKQRTEAKDKCRPVTAMQRQREREEKRNKKKEKEKERAREKNRKSREETDTDQNLSKADKELLARWQTMQAPKAPDRQTDTHTDTQAVRFSDIPTQHTDIRDHSQADHIPKHSIHTHTYPDNTNTSIQSFTNVPTFTTLNTQDLSQLYPSNDATNPSNPNIYLQNTQIIQNPHSTSTIPDSNFNSNNINNTFNNRSDISQFSEIKTIDPQLLNQDIISHKTIDDSTLHRVNFNSTQIPVFDPQNYDTLIRFNDTQIILSSDDSETIDLTQDYDSGRHVCHDTRHEALVPSRDIPLPHNITRHTDTIQQPTPALPHTINVDDMSQPFNITTHVNTIHKFNEHTTNTNTDTSSITQPNKYSIINEYNTHQTQLTNFDNISQNPTYRTNDEIKTDQQQNLQDNFNDFTTSYNINNNSNIIPGISQNLTDVAQTYKLPEQQTIDCLNQVHMDGIPRDMTGLNSHMTDDLSHVSDLITRDDVTGGIDNDLNPDLVSFLTQQFSKSQVGDILPPMLCGTPKGTGGGYGVGLDLDALVCDITGSAFTPMQQDKQDSAPVSASLLADWMDVTGNMSASELDAFLKDSEMTSPINFSDLPTPPSGTSYAS